MTDTMLFLLWFAGIPVALVAGMLALWSAEWILWQLQTATTRCGDAVAGWRENIAQKTGSAASHRDFLRWAQAQTGEEELGSAVDERLVEAQRQADLIRVLVDEEIPKAVMRCLETHRLMAQVAGAQHFAEVAYEPECYQLRTGSVWILRHTTKLLGSYPLKLEDKRLLHNALVLRKRALPTCIRCPYIQLSVAGAPLLCPTAELIQLKGSNAPSSPSQ